jgi:hypothetical protein
MEIADLLYGPLYASFGAPAVLTLRPDAPGLGITAIDRTEGIEMVRPQNLAMGFTAQGAHLRTGKCSESLANMKRRPDQAEQDELRQLIAEEKRRIDACEDMLGVAVADEASYRAAFKRLLEILPDGSRLKVTNSNPSKLH